MKGKKLDYKYFYFDLNGPRPNILFITHIN